MRARGISYGPGFRPAGQLSRPFLDPGQVERERWGSSRMPGHDDPRRDLDPASYGVVANLDDNGTQRWRPKESFHALATAYGGAGETER